MIELQIELPFGNINERLLLERLSDDFAGLTEDDLQVAVYDNHTIGIQAPNVNPSNVTQSTVETAVSNVENGLGCSVKLLNWGVPPF